MLFLFCFFWFVLLLLVIAVFCLFVFFFWSFGFYFLLSECPFLQLKTITSDTLTGHLREKSHTVICICHTYMSYIENERLMIPLCDPRIVFMVPKSSTHNFSLDMSPLLVLWSTYFNLSLFSRKLQNCFSESCCIVLLRTEVSLWDCRIWTLIRDGQRKEGRNLELSMKFILLYWLY